jgi:hypothetical protein
MEVDAAEGGADSAGTYARQARRAGAWNRHDDAAVAGILAAAKAAGATGAAIRYGEMVTKVFFVPQGAEEPQVTDKMKELQLATAQQRIDELQQRTAGAARRAKKEKERKLKQKAAKKAGQQELARREQQRATTQAATQATAQQQPQNATKPAQQVPAGQRMQVEKMGSGQAARPAPMEQQAPETARAEAVPTFGMPSSSSSAPLFGAQAPVPAPGLFSSVRVSTLFKPAEGPSGPKPGWGG